MSNQTSVPERRRFGHFSALILLIGQLTIFGQPATSPEPSALFDRAFEVFQGITNFSAGVDVQTIARGQQSSGSVLAKETWRFSRDGRVNRFTRNRYLPFRGREVIESATYSGGYLVGGTNLALPANSSLPGFEVRNFLAELRERQPKGNRRENGITVIEAELSDGVTGLAWFSTSSPLPYRIEKRRGSALILVYARSETPVAVRLLPNRDVFHLYEFGEVKTTIIRSFTGINEEFADPSASQSKSEYRGTKP